MGAAATSAPTFGGAPAFGTTPAPAAATGGLFGLSSSAKPLGGSLFGTPAPAPAGGGLFGAAPLTAAAPAAPVISQPQLRLTARFENLPKETQDWLTSTERKINEWSRVAERFPGTSFDIVASERAAEELATEAEIIGNRARLDAATLVGFKAQVQRAVGDAHQMERDFQRGHDYTYGRNIAVPTPFFEAKLRAMKQEAAALQQHISQLDAALGGSAGGRGYWREPHAGAVISVGTTGGRSAGSRRDAVRSAHGAGGSSEGATAEDLSLLLDAQHQLFQRAAARIQAQHSRMEAHRARLRQQLGYDPLAAARNRDAAVRDKYKPPAHPRMPLTTADADAHANATALAAPATTPFGAPAPAAASPFGALTNAATASSSSAFGAFSTRPAATPAPTFGAPATGSLFGSSTPALGLATPSAAPAPTAFGATPAISPFGASTTPALGLGPPALTSNGSSNSLTRTAKKKTSGSRR